MPFSFPRPYEFAEWKKVRVHIDHHVEVDRHYYSVPYRLIKEQMDARATSGVVEIFHKGDRVAAHARSHEPYKYTTLPEHRPPEHQEFAEWTPERMLEWAAKTGPGTAMTAEKIMSSRKHPEQGYRACLGILTNLVNSYGAPRVEAACCRALKFNTCSFQSVRSILKSGLDRQIAVSGTAQPLCLFTRTSVAGNTTNKKMEEHMLNETTISIMNRLKLFGMAESFAQRLSSTQQAGLSHAEFVGLLIQDEKTHRDNARLKRLLKYAKLKQQAAVEDIDYRRPRGLNKQVMLELANTQWILAGRSVLFTGPTGVGKSWLACALGNMAAREGLTVLYVRAPRMFDVLSGSRADGSRLREIERLGRVQLLIIDDLLLTPLTAQERGDFLEIVEERNGSAATIITSQCPTKDWHQNIGDPTLADAICDRLFHKAQRLELRGPSIRKEGLS